MKEALPGPVENCREATAVHNTTFHSGFPKLHSFLYYSWELRKSDEERRKSVTYRPYDPHRDYCLVRILKKPLLPTKYTRVTVVQLQSRYFSRGFLLERPPRG